MKKVFFIANSAWYLRNFRENTLKEFSNRYQTTCVYPDGEDSDVPNIAGILHKKIRLVAHSKNPILELTSFFSIFYCFLVNKPDVVFSFNPKTNLYSLISCFILRIPCVPNVSGVGVASEMRGVLGFAYRNLCKFFFRRAAFVFFQNTDDERLFLKQNLVYKEKSEVLPGSGIDLLKWTPSRVNSRCEVFLMASRLIRPKGVLEYAAAACEVHKYTENSVFYLAGVPDHSDRAVDVSIFSNAEGDSPVVFLGHIADMAKLLEGVDCVVLPSYYPEGTPRILIEAAAAGKIIITTDTPGCRDLVDSEDNGFLISPRSTQALAQAMVKAVNLTATEASRMKMMSRKKAESRYNEKNVINSYIRIAGKIL